MEDEEERNRAKEEYQQRVGIQNITKKVRKRKLMSSPSQLFAQRLDVLRNAEEDKSMDKETNFPLHTLVYSINAPPRIFKSQTPLSSRLKG